VAKATSLKIKEMKTNFGTIRDLEITIGKLLKEDWAEPVGPTPFPSVTDLRDWDFKLLKRYKPMYMPICDLCCFCTYGKCDLTKGKRGACGIDMKSQQGRWTLLTCLLGASAHAGHAAHLVEHLKEKLGADYPIDLGMDIEVEAPIMRTICGIRPRVLGDLSEGVEYVQSQLMHLLSAVNTGQEGEHLDFESKALHTGMIDGLAMEIGDIAQLVGFGFPKGEAETPFSEIGFGVVDPSKPVILCVGHNAAPGIEIVNYLKAKNMMDKVEVAGLCCTAHDITRHEHNAKIVGPISQQLRFLRAGIADVVILDEQCVRADSLEEAGKSGAPVIVTSDKLCLALPNRTNTKVEDTIAELVEGKIPGALILDPAKAGEVAVNVAAKIAPKRTKFKAIPSQEELVEWAKRCQNCGDCRRSCPNDMPVQEAINAAAEGDVKKLSDFYELCLDCGRCEEACRADIPIISLMEKAAETKLKEERYKIRIGRGPIRDVEIRNVGAPIVLGEIPGVIAFAGCANYPRGGREVVQMCEEFLMRRYIVVASGCAAMSLSLYKNDEGKTLYELYPGDFDAGCLANTGSCVSNAHIIGAAVKIASIFARRNLRANYEEIADYILNRVGATAIVWGTMSQKALAIATGANRFGIPVIVGPHGAKYRRLYLGRKDHEEDWYVYDARTGDQTYVGPSPEHLYYAAETMEEALVMAAKLCIKPNDTTKGRAIKLTHYIDLHKRYHGTLPDDIHMFVRSPVEIPVTMKDEVVKFLEEKGWKESRTPDPTMLERMIRQRK